MVSALRPDYPPSALPQGTRLGEFEILDVLGVGGFGIVYRAMDHALEREVAIKEYMPSALAGRTATLQVSLRSQSDAETFALGLRSFVNEAKLLARFDHPSLLKVYRFWEQNDTAYMAMPIYRGQTLKAVRQTMPVPPDEAWLRSVLGPLLGAIETLHAEGVYHRDIAPDNILIEPDGRPVLLDFGAARRVIGDRSQTLTAILKPAYAPIEQYAEVSASRQGPWTDLYALGATLHYVLTGEAPAPATARTLFDDQAPLATRALPGCSPTFLHAVDWMLATRPSDRPQSVAALRAVLDGQAVPPAPAAVAAVAAAAQTTALRPPAETVLDVSAPWPAAPAVADAATLIDLSQRGRPVPPQAPVSPPAEATPEPALAPSLHRRALPLLVAVVAAVAAAGWWATRDAPAGDGARMAGPLATPAGAPGSAADAARGEASAASGSARTTVVAAALQTAASAVVATPPPAQRATESPPRPAAPTRTRDDVASTPARRLPVRVEPASPSAGELLAASIATPGPAEQAAVKPALAASAPASAPAPIVTRAPVPTAAALSDDPSAVCGKRVLLALFWCMERECARDDLKGHPACRKWFAGNRQRQTP
ncbi:MAG: protein kinase [Burkholderiaceae bacterium]|nr:protein kinase [Burkholderiaceae bacterium]